MNRTDSTTGHSFDNKVYRKVTLRLIPFLFACYVLACLDRINVGFAQLQMKQDVGLSDAAYGLGAGILFIGYVLFAMNGPANQVGWNELQPDVSSAWLLRSYGETV